MSDTSQSNWRAEMDAKAREAADRLRGTCNSLQQDYEEFQDDETFCDVLDSLVFECTACNWWFEQSDNHDHPDTGEWVCTECFEEAGGKEDD